MNISNNSRAVGIAAGIAIFVAVFPFSTIAVYGLLITPIGWEYALWMWAYALAWFLVNDVVKLLAYRLLRARGEV